MSLTNGCCLGLLTFAANRQANEQCGANGLPLVPNSNKILGKFQNLKILNHPNICRYIDLERGQHERVFIVSEYYQDGLECHIDNGKFCQPSQLLNLVYDITSGLQYLNDHGINYCGLCTDNIRLSSKGEVKLFNYGLYNMTSCGEDVAFPISKPPYWSPEVFYSGNENGVTKKADIWSLGIIITEVAIGSRLWTGLTLDSLIQKSEEVFSSCDNPLKTLVPNSASIPPTVQQVIDQCLTIKASDRPCASQLRQIVVQQNSRAGDQGECIVLNHKEDILTSTLQCLRLELNGENGAVMKDRGFLMERSLEEVFHLWQLAGGDLEGILRKQGLIRRRPPITKLGRFVSDTGVVFGESVDSTVLYDPSVTILNMSQLTERLSSVSMQVFYPLLQDEFSNARTNSVPSLPLVIREKDVEYQLQRIVIMHRLLQGYPYYRLRLIQEAKIDIPPLYRGRIWAGILDVRLTDIQHYESLDKESATMTDRQIDVDIPRCHQYHQLLSSPEGHRRLKRVLKAWVIDHPQYVYWQGLDSLSAPFVVLNFTSEALAFASLKSFINKFLNNFFLKDNSHVIQEYLAVFSHVITYHDPTLSVHLNQIGFIPDLFAIPWFLTMFAHAFPLYKLFHLWDTLILGDSSFPLFIGTAILNQLRDRLLEFGFNECILLFSDLPEIKMDICVKDSICFFRSTPSTATFRQHTKNVDKIEKSDQAVPLYAEMVSHPVELSSLKTEPCCRITCADLLKLKSNGTTEQNRKIVVIDIRPPDKFARGMLLGSINLPFTLDVSVIQSKLKTSPNGVKVVVSNRLNQAFEFASKLIELHHSKVCVLHRGVESLRAAGVLTVCVP